MCFRHSHDIQQVFLFLAWVRARVTPCQHLPLQGVFKACHSHQYSMYIGRYGSVWKTLINGFCADLHADFRMPFQVDGPFKALGAKSRISQCMDCFFNTVGCDHQVCICGCHRFFRPMIDCKVFEHTPGDFQPLQSFDQEQYIATASGSLPVVELPFGHGRTLHRFAFPGNPLEFKTKNLKFYFILHPTCCIFYHHARNFST